MLIDLRRSTRKDDYLPVTVNAINGVDGSLISGPFSSRIIDFSSHGACLLMTQVLKERYHIFHTTQEDSSSLLEIVINLPPDLVNYTINARPVWLNVFRQHEISAFKLGVEFMTSPEGKKMRKIMRSLDKNQEKRGNWWAQAVSIIDKKFSA